MKSYSMVVAKTGELMQKSGKILLVMLKGSHCTISRALTSNRELKRCFRAKEMNLKDNLTFCAGIVGTGHNTAGKLDLPYLGLELE